MSYTIVGFGRIILVDIAIRTCLFHQIPEFGNPWQIFTSKCQVRTVWVIFVGKRSVYGPYGLYTSRRKAIYGPWVSPCLEEVHAYGPWPGPAAAPAGGGAGS